MLAAVIHFFSRGKQIPLGLNAPTGREDVYRKDRYLCARGSKKDPSSHIHGTKARALLWALGENSSPSPARALEASGEHGRLPEPRLQAI